MPGVNYEYIYRRETPTSLAMYSSGAFFVWQRVLRPANIDLTYFVQEEMKAAVLGELGWSSNALIELLNLESKPYEPDVSINCIECRVRNTCGFTCAVELQWLDRIEEIRLRHNQAYEIFPTTSVMDSVEDLFDTGPPVGSYRS